MFIQVIQSHTDKRAEVRQLFAEWAAEPRTEPNGWLGGTYGFTDDGDLFAVVRFESKEAAMANSARPETDAMSRKLAGLMDGPPTFLDCDDVTVWLDGGSDDAGFVQIMRGHTDDPDQLKALMSDSDDIREARPEIIGGTLAIADDGTFVQTVAFTSEKAAREGEKVPPPDDRRAAMEQAWGEIEYFDLNDPWFESA
jgi:quinol monooxygenase YgiN